MKNPQNQALVQSDVHVRIMPEIQRPELEFLRFQVGRWEEGHLFLPAIPGIRNEVNEPARRFRLLGFGETRKAALAMAGFPAASTPVLVTSDNQPN